MLWDVQNWTTATQTFHRIEIVMKKSMKCAPGRRTLQYMVLSAYTVLAVFELPLWEWADLMVVFTPQRNSLTDNKVA